MHGKQGLFEVRLLLSVNTLTAASTVWTFGSTALHRLRNYFFDRAFFCFENFFLEVNLLLFSLIVIVLLGCWLFTVSSLFTIILVRD